jgi:hypothetical protein
VQWGPVPKKPRGGGEAALRAAAQPSPPRLHDQTQHRQCLGLRTFGSDVESRPRKLPFSLIDADLRAAIDLFPTRFPPRAAARAASRPGHEASHALRRCGRTPRALAHLGTGGARCLRAMKRRDLEHVIRAAADIADDDEIIIIGNQAILGQYPDAPAELCVSVEADVYPKNQPARADLIDGSIGEGSPFHDTHGYYARGVGETTAILPSGWRERLVAVKNANTRGEPRAGAWRPTTWSSPSTSRDATRMIASCEPLSRRSSSTPTH